ncbi:COX15/CtaA family protein [Microbacterium sp. F2]|uniref:COX15/CtaA family protein n=1 Tax=Microbacterium sp. F2 TaxID=3422228 RepID=UPI003FD1CB99
MSAPSPSPARVSLLGRFWAWLPDHVDRRVRVAAWLSFLAEVLIIGTGGAVRLTGSGLGCPTWPTCTAESLVNTPAMGIHGFIEFGNRTLTGLVGILALVVLVFVLKMRRERRDLFVLSLVVLLGIIAQALVGGITVLTGLNPFIVGFHYVASVILVAVCAAFLVLMRTPGGPRVRVVTTVHAIWVHATTAVLAVTIFFGILTTGAGPHSGDADAGRNGFNAEILEHVHAWPSYALFAMTLVLLGFAYRRRREIPRVVAWTQAVLGVEVLQIAVGLFQARNGLPPLAVGIHMVLASLLAAAMTALVLNLKQPVRVSDTAEDPADAQAIHS